MVCSARQLSPSAEFNVPGMLSLFPALFLDLLSSSSEFNEGVLSRILTLLKSSNFLTPLWQTVPIMNPISLLLHFYYVREYGFLP